MASLFFRHSKKQFISIDLGTANTLIYVRGQGIVYNQPSIIAYNINTNEVISVGFDAYKMIGKGNKNIRVVETMQEGVIGSITLTKAQLRFIFNRLKLNNFIKGGTILLACPSVVTDLERRALTSIAKYLGAANVFVEEEVKMAALGGGVDINSPIGKFVVDIGGGTCDVAIIASGDVVKSSSTKTAGNVLNLEIQKYIRSQFGLDIGLKTAEDIKINIGSVGEIDNRTMEVFGRDIISGLPKKVTINDEEIREVLIVPMQKITDLCEQVLEAADPEISGDLYKNGIILCGGGSELRGIEDYLQEKLQLPVKKVADPLLAVINGTKIFESNIMSIVDNK